MGKYRKKPIIVDAEQWFPADWKPHEPAVYRLGVYCDGDGYSINTLKGRKEVTPGDWIITGVKGDRYPCKPDIFKMTYEGA